MEGAWRSSSTSLRPRPGSLRLPLPRTVLRHLIAVGEMSLGTRVLVAGSAAAPTAAYLEYLGMDATSADAGPPTRQHDAIVWIGRNQAPPGARSLLSQSFLDRTVQWMEALRPGGTLVLVNHLGRMSGGHNAECLTRHLQVFPGRSDVVVIPERPFLGFLRESARPAYAVATWQAPEEALDAAICRNRVTMTTALAQVCCSWAEESVHLRRAA